MKKYINEIRKINDIEIIMELSILISIMLVLGDYINIFTKLLSNNFLTGISILALLYLLVRISKLKLFELFKLNIINDIDGIVIYLFFTSIVFGITSLVIFKTFTYRVYICLFTLMISTILLIIRSIKINNIDKLDENINIYDLKELCEGKIKLNDKAILIDEEAVDYDLLGRDIFINNLYNVIVDNKARKKFVIALVGNWGSGKSTILNIVKKKLKVHNDIIIIDSFDPWDYNDQSSMFRAMFDAILKESEIKFSMSESRKFVDMMYEMTFDSKYGKYIKKLDLRRNQNINEVKKIKEMVNTYLNINNKKVIFIIDNIDRADKENVNLLFKLVGNVLNFENITYLLSYDDLKVKNIMNDDLKVDYNYLKKIIQLEIQVPIINKGKKYNIVEKSIKNLLLLYGENKETLYRYNSLITNISDTIKDIRDLKRYINSVITFYYRSNKRLYTIDTISIETIKMNNIELYKSIIENKRYFISEDKINSTDLYNEVFVNKKKFNEESKIFFDTLFSEEDNKKFLDILSEIFPYVKKYKNGEDLLYYGNIIHTPNKEEQITRVSNKRIYSAKFFDLYFTESSNYFTEINDDIETFLNMVNDGDIIESLSLFIGSISKNAHRDFFDTLYLFINKIHKEKLVDLLSMLFKCINSIDDSSSFIGLSARNRVCIIISDILFMISDNDFNKFTESIKFEYCKLQIVNNISYWIDKNKEVSENTRKRIYKLWNEMYEEMASHVYDSSIDIYRDYYSYGNIYGLVSGIDGSKRDIKHYMKKVLNEKTIIKFLYDIMSKVTGSRVKYYIKKDNINRFTSEDEVNSILNMKEDYSIEEEIILNIYKISMEIDAKDFTDDERLTYDSELDFNI